MGRYCACGAKYYGVEVHCVCDKIGWHDIFENESDLPNKEGVYDVRVTEDGEQYETTSEFSLEKRDWNNHSIEPSHWSEDYEDNWLGWRKVYAWREDK